MTTFRAVDAATTAEIRRLNVVIHEDDETITAVAPCPTAAHRPEKVASTYLVEFTCKHATNETAFCTPCTAIRRAGTNWACLSTEHRVALAQGDMSASCDETRVTNVRVIHPVTRLKG
jgi:hypothetical protein